MHVETEASGHWFAIAPPLIPNSRATILRPVSTPTHTLTMQSLPDARSQSFEELYGPPENFLEIEVG